jgi:integrase
MIPISAELINILITQIPESEKDLNNYVVYPKNKTWSQKEKVRKNINAQWKTLIKKAGFKNGVNRFGYLSPITPHVMRYTFCSLLLQKGIAPYKIQKWSGHSNRTMLEHYGHISGLKDLISFDDIVITD